MEETRGRQQRFIKSSKIFRCISVLTHRARHPGSTAAELDRVDLPRSSRPERDALRPVRRPRRSWMAIPPQTDNGFHWPLPRTRSLTERSVGPSRESIAQLDATCRQDAISSEGSPLSQEMRRPLTAKETVAIRRLRLHEHVPISAE